MLSIRFLHALTCMVKHAQYMISLHFKSRKQKRAGIVGLLYPASSLAPIDRYSYFIAECDEVRLMSLSQLETCSVYLDGKEVWSLSV